MAFRGSKFFHIIKFLFFFSNEFHIILLYPHIWYAEYSWNGKKIIYLAVYRGSERNSSLDVSEVHREQSFDNWSYDSRINYIGFVRRAVRALRANHVSTQVIRSNRGEKRGKERAAPRDACAAAPPPPPPPVLVVAGSFRSVLPWKSPSVVAITGTAALGRSLRGGLPRDSRTHLLRYHATRLTSMSSRARFVKFWPSEAEVHTSTCVCRDRGFRGSLRSIDLSDYRRILRVTRLFRSMQQD